MTTTKEELVRLDCIGRIRFSHAQREALLDGYDSSGLSGPQFAAQHGVKYQTFATWLQKRKRAKSDYPVLGNANEVSFVLAEVSQPRALVEESAASALEIRLPGGACLLIRDESQAALAAGLLQRMAGGGKC